MAVNALVMVIHELTSFLLSLRLFSPPRYFGESLSEQLEAASGNKEGNGTSVGAPIIGLVQSAWGGSEIDDWIKVRRE